MLRVHRALQERERRALKELKVRRAQQVLLDSKDRRVNKVFREHKVRKAWLVLPLRQIGRAHV